MKKTQIKDILRNIRANCISWLAVSIVTMIACGVYCGAFFYADELESTAADFFARTNVEDFTVMSAKGLTEPEIRQLLSVPGITDAEGSYWLSGVSLYTAEQQLSVDLFAVTERVSVPEPVEGSLPSASTECALTADMMQKYGLRPGDTVSLKLNDAIPAISFTVTGSVLHGENYFQGETLRVFVPKATFREILRADSFPRVLVDAEGIGGLLSDDYFSGIAPVRQGILDAMDGLNAATEKAETMGFAITTRSEMEGYQALKQIAEMLRKLATIFVIIFMGVGTIVVFSTITVVIDGQKKLIGSMKANGFRNGEIMRRYLVYGESAVLFGMLCTVGVAFLLQMVIRHVLSGLFCLEIHGFSFQPVSFLVLLLAQTALTGLVTAVVTEVNANRYSAVELMNWNGEHPAVSRKSDNTGIPEKKRHLSLYSRLILRNMHSDRARVLASVIIIGCSCGMIGVGLTLNSSYHSMTENTRQEIRRYDLECAVPAGTEIRDALEGVLGCGADCVAVTSTQTVYGYGDKTEYVTVITADNSVYSDYIRLTEMDGNILQGPDSGVLIQNRISERFGIRPGDELTIFDGVLNTHTVRVDGSVKNYIGRVIYMSEELYETVFGFPPAANNLLIRLNGTDPDNLAAFLRERFPGAAVSRTDTMPPLFSGLTDAFNALIYVMITLSVIMSFFVLLNLVNIFVSRRRNELIVMGINGFSYREEIGYLIRETVFTTLAGLGIGMLVIVLITETLVRIIEAPDTMCVRSVNWPACAVAAAVEAMFALVINSLAFRRVKHLGKDDLK